MLERQETQILVPGLLLTHWVASGKSLKSSRHHSQQAQNGALVGGQCPVRSEARFNGETKSVQTKPSASGHCLERHFCSWDQSGHPERRPYSFFSS